MGPSWGLDRDVACAAFLDALLKTHAHHRRQTQVPASQVFVARLRLLARRYTGVAHQFRARRAVRAAARSDVV
eukprot:7612000-Pyramimonas_sp.AAC.1